MKKRTIMLFVAAAATVTSLMAQTPANRTALTPEQKEQMQDIREKHAPKIKAIKDDIRLNKVEQKTLLASKEIDQKAIYANIDALGELKATLHNETASLRNAMKEVCPNADKMYAKRQHQQRPMQGQGYQKGNKQGPNNGVRNGQGTRHNRQGMQQGQGAHQAQMRNSNGQRNNGRNGVGRYNQQGKHQNTYKQGQQRQHMMFGTNCKLTEEQKTAIAEIKKEHFWSIQETQNELALLKAKNTTAEERQAAFNEVNTLQTKLAKARMALKLDIMAQLTEEQRMQMIAKMKQRNTRAKQHKSPRRA